MNDGVIGISNLCIQNQPQAIPWIWDGVLARGAITLLSATEKIGKTTLLSLLLDRRRDGGELLDRDIWPGRTVVCSEESPLLWILRQPPLDFGPNLIFHHPVSHVPNRKYWTQFCEELCVLQFGATPFDLLVIDTAIHFMPLGHRNENVLRWTLATLKRITQTRAAVLVINQSSMMHRPLAAYADIVIEMSIPRGSAARTRRRQITGVGRYPGTLDCVSADLSEDGTDYVCADPARRIAPLLPTVQALLTASATPLTHAELMARWPGEAPNPASLRRILANGCERGIFAFAGQGTKDDPFRFGLMKVVDTV